MPRKYVIITQRRIGENTSYIADRFPKLYAYLTKNESRFSRRKSSIYKNKPAFSIFGIGEYTFKPYKVAISGLYKRSMFSLILPVQSKPIMLDDTCYFLGFDDMKEAICVWAVLNSEIVQELLSTLVFTDAKRPFTKELLMRIQIGEAARRLPYPYIVERVSTLDKGMLSHLTRAYWDQFLDRFISQTAQQTQLQLFREAI